MNQKQLNEFIKTISLTIKQAGIVALNLQGKVENTGKEAEALFQHASKKIIDSITAKTIIDETVQEILLFHLKELFDTKEVTLDAEENTPLVKYFTSNSDKLSIIIDPIDGTIDYLNNDDRYSICLSLVSKGKVLTAIIFFPKRDHFYFLGADKIAYIAEYFFKDGLKNARILNSSDGSKSKIVYVNERVSENIVTSLKNLGYEIKTYTGTGTDWTTALLKCLSGEYKAFIAKLPHPRDILIGALIENGVKNGYGLDWSGKKLHWPKKGRIPEVIFGAGKPPKYILEILKNYAN